MSHLARILNHSRSLTLFLFFWSYTKIMNTLRTFQQSNDPFTLASLPSDIIRNIIRLDEESLDELRLVRFNSTISHFPEYYFHFLRLVALGMLKCLSYTRPIVCQSFLSTMINNIVLMCTCTLKCQRGTRGESASINGSPFRCGATRYLCFM